MYDPILQLASILMAFAAAPLALSVLGAIVERIRELRYGRPGSIRTPSAEPDDGVRV